MSFERPDRYVLDLSQPTTSASLTDLILEFPPKAEPERGPALRRSGYVQGWLHKRPWPLWRIGNLVSDVRFLIWRWHNKDAP